jgi:mannose-6-phosphate isomerase-like protein (cupin superfamily)
VKHRAAFQREDAVGERQYQIEIVLDDHDGDVLAQGVEHAEKFEDHGRREALEGFVKQQQPWLEFPNHFGGALSKPLVMPETAGSRHIDFRISMYQPMAHVARHKHQVQEQIYHVLEGEGLIEIAGKNHVVRKHDFLFPPPGVEHAISNSGLVDLVFLVITSPVTDDAKPV